MKTHIGELRKLQAELHGMGSRISDEDLVAILVTLLLESWDIYTSSYLGASGNQPTVNSHELIAVLIEEENQRKGRKANSLSAMVLQARRKPHCDKKDMECFNCHKKGHMAKDCWAPGNSSGNEKKNYKGKGKGRNRANQSQENDEDINESLNDIAYFMCAAEGSDFKKDDWVLDSVMMSHLMPLREVFTQYQKCNAEVSGIRNLPVTVIGQGTVQINFDING